MVKKSTVMKDVYLLELQLRDENRQEGEKTRRKLNKAARRKTEGRKECNRKSQ